MKKIFWLALFLPSLAFAETNRNYAGVKNFLNQLTRQNAATAKSFELGLSDSGEKILGVKIGNGPTRSLVVGTHHGNEYGSAEVALAFAASVAANPIPGHTTYVIPVLNIGGYDKRSRYENAAGGRLADPNRDYPGPCGTDGPFRLKSTKALADFVEREKIISSATLHTFYPAVVYPWGISTQDLDTPYNETFQKLVEAATEESRYQIGNSTRIMYPADGTFEDYAFWKHGIWSILFELGSSHSPSEGEIQQMIAVNVPGIRRMLATAPTTLASNHAFTGRCDFRLKSLDRRDE